MEDESDAEKNDKRLQRIIWAVVLLAIVLTACILTWRARKNGAAFLAEAQPAIDQARAFVHDLENQQWDSAFNRCTSAFHLVPQQSLRRFSTDAADAALRPGAIVHEEYRIISRRRHDGQTFSWRVDSKLTLSDQSVRYGQFILAPDGAGAPKISEYNIETPDSKFELGVIPRPQKNDAYVEYAPGVRFTPK